MSIEIAEELSKPLDPVDIEVRISTSVESGFMLLLYKTARTDVKRLNQVCGLNWSNEFFYDDKGILACKVTVDGTSRVDVGTESNTEKEKGSYSDAFKRACFKFGIGSELYTAPTIFVKWDMYKDSRSNKFKPSRFYPKNVIVTKYEVEDGVIKSVELKYIDYGKTKTIYNSGNNDKQPKPKAKPAVERPNQGELNDLEGYSKEVGKDIDSQSFKDFKANASKQEVDNAIKLLKAQLKRG